jgi:hypothetical protein
VIAEASWALALAASCWLGLDKEAGSKDKGP